MSRKTTLSMELETRKARISVADVLRIFVSAPWTKDRSAEEVRRMLAHTHHAVLAKVDGEAVGFARLITDRVCRGFVEDVIVLPQFQGQGIARRMMEALETLARQLGLPRLELTTRQPAFWEGLGYVQKVGSTYLVKPLRERSA